MIRTRTLPQVIASMAALLMLTASAAVSAAPASAEAASSGPIVPCLQNAGDPSPDGCPEPPEQECRDGVDNDSDGRTDHPDDPGCTSPWDNSESPDPPTA